MTVIFCESPELMLMEKMFFCGLVYAFSDNGTECKVVNHLLCLRYLVNLMDLRSFALTVLLEMLFDSTLQGYEGFHMYHVVISDFV